MKLISILVLATAFGLFSCGESDDDGKESVAPSLELPETGDSGDFWLQDSDFANDGTLALTKEQLKFFTTDDDFDSFWSTFSTDFASSVIGGSPTECPYTE